MHLMKYLNGTREDVLTLSADSLTRVMWWVDASFAVHPDMRSHTGAVMSMGDGAISFHVKETEAEHQEQHRG